MSRSFVALAMAAHLIVQDQATEQGAGFRMGLAIGLAIHSLNPALKELR